MRVFAVLIQAEHLLILVLLDDCLGHDLDSVQDKFPDGLGLVRRDLDDSPVGLVRDGDKVSFDMVGLEHHRRPGKIWVTFE